MPETLLVTGIHREELGFGDRVAALFGPDTLRVMRIPEGISNTRSAADDIFYYNTQHKEIYLQLHQQVKGKCGLLIDLHCGLNGTGRCADIYCRQESVLVCLGLQAEGHDWEKRLRLIRILDDQEEVEIQSAEGSARLSARTTIPEQIWKDQTFVYVGLEIYLATEGEGVEEDWRFARTLIESVQRCVH